MRFSYVSSLISSSSSEGFTECSLDQPTILIRFVDKSWIFCKTFTNFSYFSWIAITSSFHLFQSTFTPLCVQTQAGCSYVQNCWFSLFEYRFLLLPIRVCLSLGRESGAEPMPALSPQGHGRRGAEGAEAKGHVLRITRSAAFAEVWGSQYLVNFRFMTNEF